MAEESRSGQERAAEESGEGGDRGSPVERLIKSDDWELEHEPHPGPAALPQYSAGFQQGSVPGGILLLAGVGVPTASIMIELLSGICADAYIDPLPTYWHLSLVGFVPFANWLLWRKLRSPQPRYR
ncbi:MAG: hypothetical protein L0220_30205 [Acidobacteria bacterium]|nr:hypothetical protein [Acidobacteriota bacterium]